MYTYFDNKFNRGVVVIQPGELYVSDNPVICTVLGSCVAVVFYNPARKMGGMNHYMLAGKSPVDGPDDQTGRYGENAIQLLLEALRRRGIQKEELVAKVFGGGFVLEKNDPSISNVSESNYQFVFQELRRLNIQIAASDVGGTHPRKLFFFPETGKVKVKKIEKQDIQPQKQ